MKIIPIQGAVSDAILAELQKRQINEQGRPIIPEKTTDAREGFVMIGGTQETTEATFTTFNDNFPGAGIIKFCAQPKLFKGFPAERILFVGCRTWDKETHAQLRARNSKQYLMHEIIQEGISDVCDSVMSAAKDFPALYMSIDASVLDPAFVPSENPEPGGMTTRELLYFIRRLKMLKNLKAIDITGIKEESAKIGAKLLSELL
ncbi:MAG: arginase family protein [Candidatus Woesearchaeota archaeon]